MTKQQQLAMRLVPTLVLRAYLLPNIDTDVLTFSARGPSLSTGAQVLGAGHAVRVDLALCGLCVGSVWMAAS